MKLLSGTITSVLLFTTTHTVAQDLSAKTNAYIECYNGVSGRAIQSINRYNSWVKDMEAGPTGKEKTVYGLYGLHDHAIKACRDKVPVAIAAEPKAEALDKAADDYLKAALALNEKIKKAERYYSRENYKDDDFAKGKEMHKPLVEAMNNFVAANDALGAALDGQSGDAMKLQLAEIEKASGKNFDYWLLSSVIEAKAAVDVLSQDEFDVDAAKKLISAYEDSADEVADLISANSDDMNLVKYSTLPMTMDNYRLALKQRMRRVRDNTPYSTGEKQNLNPSSGWMVDGSTYKVTDTYNKLIQAINR